MELKFAERLRKYRRDRDMTQEELAQKIGISPQSVSKWERDEGLPDVTMLPKLAGYFGVTIDALLGYDETAQKEDFDTYFQESRKIYDTQEKFDYIRGYAEKYPQDYRYARDLVHAITELPREKWDEYMPLMRENCEKIVNGCTIQWFREQAIRDMCMICPDAELEKWKMLCASGYDAHREEVIENRLAKQGRKEEAILQHSINNFEIVCHFLTRSNHDHRDAARTEMWCRNQMKFLEFLGGGDGVPELWRGRYAHCAMEISRMMFWTGRNEEGYEWLDRAFELYDIWCAIPDGTPLDTGNPDLFGGIRGVKGLYGDHAWDILLPDGTYRYFHEAHAYILPEKTDLYHMIFHWFGAENVRDEERMQPYIARAKALAGIEE